MITATDVIFIGTTKLIEYISNDVYIHKISRNYCPSAKKGKFRNKVKRVSFYFRIIVNALCCNLKLQ